MAVAYDSIIYNHIMDEVEKVLLEVRDEIQNNMASEGINASRRTSAGFQVQRYESGIRLVLAGDDVAPLYTLETGRGGGKIPSGFTEILEQWSRDKGIPFRNEKERRRFAFLLGRKIAASGTERNQHPKDVYSAPVNEGLRKLKEGIRASVSEYVRYVAKDLQIKIKTK